MKTKLLFLATFLLAMGGSLPAQTNTARMLSGTNVVTSCPYTIQATDQTKLLIFNSASACAVSLPAATTANFGAGAIFSVSNRGAGTATITPVTSTINGSASLALTTNQGADIYSDGTNYQTQSGGGGGGGASPAGNNGDLQSKSGSSLAASHINDNGSLIAVSEDQKNCGANPIGIDVRCFGVRFVSATTAPATTGITATCTATNTSLPISAASTFQNGDGIVVFGCGASSGMSTPSAPTVTTSLAGAPPGTGVVVTAPSNGSTVTCYKYADRDKGQGLTVASAETCATGQPLGQQTISIVSSSISNNTMTYTTAARSPELLAVGMYVCIAGTTADGIYGGCMVIASLPANTSFTATSGNDTRAGASSAGATGGTMTYWRMNHVVPPSPGTNVWQHIYYAGATGAETFDGIGQVVNSNLSADGTYQVWDDLGSPYTTPPTRPFFIPNSPPSAAVADSLVTTIASGAGTTTLTLTTAPTTTPGSSEPILLEFGQNVAAAFAAAQTAQTQVYVPQSSAGQLVVNAFTDLTSYYNTGINVAGGLYLNDTLSIRGDWTGELVRGNLSTPQFSYSGFTVININAANPGILITAGGLVQGFAFQVTGTQNQYNSVYLSGGNIPSLRMENCAFTGSSASDYSGVNFSAFGKGVAGSNPAGLIFRNILTNSNQGNSATSQWMIKNFGEINFDGVIGSGRGFYIGQLGTGTNVDYNGRIEIQGMSTPFFTAYPQSSSINFYLSNVVEDTGAMPIITALNSGVTARMSNVSQPSSGIPVVSGYPMTIQGISVNGPSAGPNTGATGIGSGFIVDGIFGGSQPIQTQNLQTAIGPDYSLFTSAGTPAAPTCQTITTSGPFPTAGTYQFQYFGYYPNGGAGLISPASAGCTVNGTSQAIVVTIPAALPSATSYGFYLAGTGNLSKQNNSCVTAVTTLSSLYEGGNCGSVSPQVFPGGGPAGMQNGTVWAQNFAGPASSGSAPATATVYLSPNCPVGSTTAPCIYTPANTVVEQGCSWGSSSPLVTCSSANFLVTANTSQIAFGLANCDPDQSVPFSGQITTTHATIANVLTATTLNLGANPSNAVGSGGCFIHGNPDDTGAAAVDAVLNSQIACPKIELAAGGYMFTTFHFLGNPTACQNLGTQVNSTSTQGNIILANGEELEGRGPGPTVWYLPPDFPETGSCVNGVNSDACWAMPLLAYWHHFSMAGNGNNSLPASKALLAMNLGQLDYFSCYDIGQSSSSSMGLELNYWAQGNNDNLAACGARNVFEEANAFGMFQRLDLETGTATGSTIGTNLTVNGWLTCIHCEFLGSFTTATAPIDVAVNTSAQNVKFFCYSCFLGSTPVAGAGTSSTFPIGIRVSGSAGTAYVHLIDTLFNNGGPNTEWISIQNNLSAGGSSQVILDNTILSHGSSGGSINDSTGTGTMNVIANSGTSMDVTGFGNFVAISLVADGHALTGVCTGTATSSATLGLYNTEMNPSNTTTTCTSTTVGAGKAVESPRTLSSLYVKATHAGVSASSGVVTVMVNGASSTITCTIGTATSCFDAAHTVSLSTGDRVSIQFTTQATEVLAGVTAFVMWNP